MSVLQLSHNPNTTTPRRKNGCQKLRTFSPVILFHDHQYVKSGSGDLEHIHIPYGDPSYGAHLELHKKRIHDMLQTNGKYWLDIITWTREHPEPAMTEPHQYHQSLPERQTSPVPSLVSSSSPTPPYLRQHYPSSTNHYHDYKHYQTSAPPSPPADYYIRATTTGNHRHMTGGDKSVKSMTPVAQDNVIKATANATTASSANNKRRRGNLPKAVTAILRDWLSRHKKHPYPTEEEKAALAAETNLNMNQISNWFINARRRILQPMLEKEEQEEHEAGGAKNTTVSETYPLHPQPPSVHNAFVSPAVITPSYDPAYHHNQQHTLPSIYHHPQYLPHSPPYDPPRRLSGRKRSAADVALTPTKYPPQKRMSTSSATTSNRRRS